LNASIWAIAVILQDGGIEQHLLFVSIVQNLFGILVYRNLMPFITVR
jgi:hypothetical protein